MANHTSERAREETPHVTNASRTIISNALKRRAQSIIKNNSIDPQSRAIIRYGLETNDPWLSELVRRVDAGETIIDNLNFSQTPATNDDSSEEKIEALAEMICRAVDEPGTKSAALLVLMATLENAKQQPQLDKTAKEIHSISRSTQQWQRADQYHQNILSRLAAVEEKDKQIARDGGEADGRINRLFPKDAKQNVDDNHKATHEALEGLPE